MYKSQYKSTQGNAPCVYFFMRIYRKFYYLIANYHQFFSAFSSIFKLSSVLVSPTTHRKERKKNSISQFWMSWVGSRPAVLYLSILPMTLHAFNIFALRWLLYFAVICSFFLQSHFRFCGSMCNFLTSSLGLLGPL